METDIIQKQANLIRAILNLSGLEKITANSGKIHKVFYDLKQEFPEYFKRLMFDTNGHIPVSEDLDEILFTFKLSGRIYWDGCRHYKLCREEESKFIKELENNYLKEIPKIKEIADKFRGYIQ